MKIPYHDIDHHPSEVLFSGKLRWIMIVAFLLFTISEPLARHIAEFRKAPEDRWFPLVELWRHPNQRSENLLFEKKSKNPLLTRDSPDLLDHLQSFEAGIKESDAQKAIQSSEQALLYRLFQSGNRKVVIGKDGWLHYQAEVDALTGFGPFKPEPDSVTKDPERPVWTPALPVIESFATQLRERGIELMIVPIPMKTMVHPEGLTPPIQHSITPSIQHPDQDRFYNELRTRKITVLDLLPLFEKAKAKGDVFLRQDTHWRAEIAKQTAQVIGQEISARDWYQALPKTFTPVFATVERSSLGDLVGMLGLPASHDAFAKEHQLIQQVLDPQTGQAVDGDLLSPISLIGDSFINIYEEPGLGFGDPAPDDQPSTINHQLIGAGLGSHLSAYLKIRPNIIAINGEGASGVRQLFAGLPDNVVRSKKLVIWAIASRDFLLSESAASRAGVVWREVEFNPESEEITPPAAPDAAPLVLTAVLKQKSAIEDPSQTPYSEAIYATQFDQIEVESGRYEGSEALVYLWAFKERKLLPTANLLIGKRYRLKLLPLSDQAEISRKTQLSDFLRLDLKPLFALKVVESL